MPALQPSPDTATDRAARHDSLTPARQEEFLEALAATGSVSHAAASVGISRAALYKLRNHPDGGAFNQRWIEALRNAMAVLTETAFDRALNGVAEPVWYKGEQIGERVRHNDRLLMFLLRNHDHARPTPEPARAPVRDNRVLVSTLSTSQSDAGEPEDDLDDPQVFRAALRDLRSQPPVQRLSKRNARRLAAKGRLGGSP